MSKTIGQKLRQVIDERGIKQTWVAGRAGISPTTLNSILEGRRNPRAENVAKIALALGISTDWLLGLTDRAS
jgi:transcriptional regulator with XRE-family HTH domain